eukprot:TRINITY_DN18162_c0_g1_i2.p1 TRINITY_DN18162_c0_g1~~TRINITY_DN18162_c0_g1_i2.p1  ORF type:complete len:2070 (+),score=486.74 TRINITY_DN18162_c0_g1_i2:50-6259(+)
MYRGLQSPWASSSAAGGGDEGGIISTARSLVSSREVRAEMDRVKHATKSSEPSPATPTATPTYFPSSAQVKVKDETADTVADLKKVISSRAASSYRALAETEAKVIQQNRELIHFTSVIEEMKETHAQQISILEAKNNTLHKQIQKSLTFESQSMMSPKRAAIEVETLLLDSQRKNEAAEEEISRLSESLQQATLLLHQAQDDLNKERIDSTQMITSSRMDIRSELELAHLEIMEKHQAECEELLRERELTSQRTIDKLTEDMDRLRAEFVSVEGDREEATRKLRERELELQRIHKEIESGMIEASHSSELKSQSERDRILISDLKSMNKRLQSREGALEAKIIELELAGGLAQEEAAGEERMKAAIELGTLQDRHRTQARKDAEELGRLRGLLSASEAKLELAEEQVLSLESKYDQQARQLNEMAEYQSTVNAQVDSRNLEIEQSDSKILQLERALTEARALLGRQAGQLQASQERVVTLDAKTQELQQLLDDSERGCAQMTAETSEAKTTTEVHASELQKARANYESLEDKYNESHNKLRDMKMEIQQKQELIESTRTQLQQAEDRAAGLESALASQAQGLRIQLQTDAESAFSTRLTRERTEWESAVITLEQQIEVACARRRYQASLACNSLEVSDRKRILVKSYFTLLTNVARKKRSQVSQACGKMTEEIDAMKRRELALQEELDMSVQQTRLAMPKPKNNKKAADILESHNRLLIINTCFSSWLIWSHKRSMQCSHDNLLKAKDEEVRELKTEALLRQCKCLLWSVFTQGRNITFNTWLTWMKNRKIEKRQQEERKLRESKRYIQEEALEQICSKVAERLMYSSFLNLYRYWMGNKIKEANLRESILRNRSSEIAKQTVATLFYGLEHRQRSWAYHKWQRWWAKKAFLAKSALADMIRSKQRQLARDASLLMMSNGTVRTLGHSFSNWKRWFDLKIARKSEILMQHIVERKVNLRNQAASFLLVGHDGRITNRYFLRLLHFRNRKMCQRFARLREDMMEQRIYLGKHAMGLLRANIENSRTTFYFDTWRRFVEYKRRAMNTAKENLAVAKSRIIVGKGVDVLERGTRLFILCSYYGTWLRWLCLRRLKTGMKELEESEEAKIVDLSKARAEIDELNTYVTKVMAENAQLTAANEQSNSGRRALEDANARLEAGLSEAQNEFSIRCDNFTSINVELETKCEQLTNQLHDLRLSEETWRSRANEPNPESERSQQQIAVLEQSLKMAQINNDKLQSQQNEFMREKEELLDSARELQNNLGMSQVETTAAREAIAHAKAAHQEEIADYQRRDAALQKEAAHLRAALREADVSVAAADTRYNEVAGELERITSTYNSEAELNHTLKHALEEVKSNNTRQAEKLISDVVALESQLEICQQESNTYRNKSLEFETLAAELQGRLDQVEGIRQRLRSLSQGREADDDYDDRLRELTQRAESAEARVQEMEQKLKEEQNACLAATQQAVRQSEIASQEEGKYQGELQRLHNQEKSITLELDQSLGKVSDLEAENQQFRLRLNAMQVEIDTKDEVEQKQKVELQKMKCEIEMLTNKLIRLEDTVKNDTFSVSPLTVSQSTKFDALGVSQSTPLSPVEAVGSPEPPSPKSPVEEPSESAPPPLSPPSPFGRSGQRRSRRSSSPQQLTPQTQVVTPRRKVSLSSEEQRRLRWIFEYGDADKDGHLSYAELQKLSTETQGSLDKEQYEALLDLFGATEKGLREEHLEKLYIELGSPGDIDDNYEMLQGIVTRSDQQTEPQGEEEREEGEEGIAAEEVQSVGVPDIDTKLAEGYSPAASSAGDPLSPSMRSEPGLPAAQSFRLNPDATRRYGKTGSLPFKISLPTKSEPEPPVIVSTIQPKCKTIFKDDLIIEVINPAMNTAVRIATRQQFREAVSPAAGVFEGSQITLKVVREQEAIKKWRAVHKSEYGTLSAMSLVKKGRKARKVYPHLHITKHAMELVTVTVGEITPDVRDLLLKDVQETAAKHPDAKTIKAPAMMKLLHDPDVIKEQIKTEFPQAAQLHGMAGVTEVVAALEKICGMSAPAIQQTQIAEQYESMEDTWQVTRSKYLSHFYNSNK